MLKSVLRHKTVCILSLASLIFTGGGFAWTYFALRTVNDSPLILHFDDISGITSVGSMAHLVFIGVLGLIGVVMNFFIALELDARDRFLGTLAAALTLFFAALLFIAFSVIIHVN